MTDRERLLSLSDGELDGLLGDALYADDFGLKAPSDDEKRRRGQRWFVSQMGEMRQAVCAHGLVRRYVDKKDSSERELFDAVVAALAALTGISVPVGILAAKVIRFGVTNLCQADEPH